MSKIICASNKILVTGDFSGADGLSIAWLSDWGGGDEQVTNRE